MPRDASGNYTLPSGNPVIPGTTITSIWANTTMEDIAQALTDSLDRNGRGGMLAAFSFASGSETSPGFQWVNDSATGWRLFALSDMRAVVSGVGDALRINSNLLELKESDTNWYKALTYFTGLPLAGGTMTGPLILSDDPVSAMEAATKQYADNMDADTRTYVDDNILTIGGHTSRAGRNIVTDFGNDWNNVTVGTMVYEPDSTALNKPGSASSVGFGLVMALNSNNLTQIYIDKTFENAYFRVRTAGVWSDWSQFAEQGYLDDNFANKTTSATQSFNAAINVLNASISIRPSTGNAHVYYYRPDNTIGGILYTDVTSDQFILLKRNTANIASNSIIMRDGSTTFTQALRYGNDPVDINDLTRKTWVDTNFVSKTSTGTQVMQANLEMQRSLPIIDLRTTAGTQAIYRATRAGGIDLMNIVGDEPGNMIRIEKLNTSGSVTNAINITDFYTEFTQVPQTNNVPTGAEDLCNKYYVDSVASTNLVTGRVSSSGTIVAGTGFTVSRTSIGNYTISFTTPMNSDNYSIQVTGENMDLVVFTVSAATTTTIRLRARDFENSFMDSGFYFEAKNIR